MNHITGRTVAFAGVWALTVGAAIAQPQGPSPESVNPEPGSMVLSLTSDHSTFSLYEPVYLTCTLRNPTYGSVIINVRSLSLSDNNLAISVQEGDGEITRYKFGPIHETIGTAQREMLPAGYPGDRLVEMLRVFFNNKSGTLAFPRIGSYRIYGRVFVGSFPEPVYLNASPVGITVVEPSRVDLELIQSLGSSEELVRLFHRGSTEYCQEADLPQCYANLRNLISRFADSAYAPAIALDLGASVGRASRATQGDSGLQVTILTDFLVRWPKHTAAPIAMGMLVDALNKAGRSKEALEWKRRFEELYPERNSPRRSPERSER